MYLRIVIVSRTMYSHNSQIVQRKVCIHGYWYHPAVPVHQLDPPWSILKFGKYFLQDLFGTALWLKSIQSVGIVPQSQSTSCEHALGLLDQALRGTDLFLRACVGVTTAVVVSDATFSIPSVFLGCEFVDGVFSLWIIIIQHRD